MSFFLYNSYDDFDHIKHEVVADFCKEYCNDCESFCNIPNEMGNVEFKNSINKTPTRTLKKTWYMSI